MRNKFLLILLVITLGMMGTAKASTVDETPYIKLDEIYETGLSCAGDGKEELELIELDEQEDASKNDALQIKDQLLGDAPYNIKFQKPYYFKERIKVMVKYSYKEDGDEGNVKEKNDKKQITIDEDLASNLGYIEYGDTGFYLLEEAVNELLESDRPIFVIDGDKISIADLSEGALYTEKEAEEAFELEFLEGPYVLEEVELEYGSVKNISDDLERGKLFYVCDDEAKPDDGLVASNGASINDVTSWEGKLKLSKFVPEETCAFFWVVNNGGNVIDSQEGLNCAEKLTENGLCSKHFCKECVKPVIGVNLTDGRSPKALVYQGDDELLYSEYCVEHFCLYYKCRAMRASKSSTSSTFYEWTGKLISIPGYCSQHNKLCTINGCTNVVTRGHFVKTESGEAEIVYVCETHWGNGEKYKELQNLDPKTGSLGTLNDEDIIEKCTCGGCGRLMIRYYYDDNGVSHELGKVIDGVWKCSTCSVGSSIEGLTEEQLTGEGDDTEGTSGNYGGSSDYDGGSYYTPSTPTPTSTPTPDSSTCNHSAYPVPNTVTFTDVTATTHVQVWTCTNCKVEQKQTYEHTYIDGKCVCGKEEDKNAPTIELVGLEVDSDNVVVASVETNIALKLADDTELKSLKYMLLGNGLTATTIEKELTGTEQEIQIQNVFTQNGTYYLNITELKDAQGNNTTITYTIIVKESEKPEFAVENALSQSEVNGMVYLKMNEGDSKLSFLFTDNEALSTVTYSYNGVTRTVTLSGTEQRLEVDIDISKCYIFKIDKLEDASGNAIENVSIWIQ